MWSTTKLDWGKLKPKPKKPIVVNITNMDRLFIKCHGGLRLFLFILLFITAIHILIFYTKSLFLAGISESISVKYAVYISIGCFFALFIHNREIEKMFGARDIEPID